MHRDDLCVDHGVSGPRASRTAFDKALQTLIDGDTLVITALDRLGQSTLNMISCAQQLRERGSELRLLNLGGGGVDTATPRESMLFTIIAALHQMEDEIKRERITDPIKKRRDAGLNLGGRPSRITDSQTLNAMRLVDSGEPAAQVARDLGMSRSTFYRPARAITD